MIIRYAFGPNAGSTAHVPRDQFVQILINAGVLELVEEPQFNVAPQPAPAASLVTQYFVGPIGLYGKLAITKRTGACIEYLSVHPNEVKRYWPDCPDEVLAAWSRTDVRERAQLGQGVPDAGKFSANTNQPQVKG